MSKTGNDYIALYRALLWGRESTVRSCASKYSNKKDSYLVELACGLSQLSTTPWYRFDQKFIRFCMNTWMRHFRKNALRVLLTEGYTPNTPETIRYCKPIIAALLKQYSRNTSLSTEDQGRQSNLIVFAKTQKWNDLVPLDDENRQVEPKPTVAPTSTSSDITQPSVTSDEVNPPYVPSYYWYSGPYSNYVLVKHNPNASTSTAESHHLNLDKPD
jgi:hypothetical protein